MFYFVNLVAFFALIMTSKDGLLSVKQQSVSDNDVVANQYANLNLNQNHKCLNSSIVQSNSKSNSYNKSSGLQQPGKSDSKIFENEKHSWNKTTSDDLHSKPFKSLAGFDKAEENVKAKRWKNNSFDATSTTSTLSLHIAAYENSVEGDTVSLDKKEGLKRDLINEQRQLFINSTLNAFEFPRQQTDDKTDPAVMQFTASQQLFYPNQLNTSNNKLESDLITMSFRPCTNIEEDLKPIERNGLLYYEHGTHITVVCLMPNHPALKSPIESISFFQKNACLVGKGKKGACKVEGRSRLCEIKNTDGTSHIIRYGIPGTLLEGNGRLLTDPELLRRSPTYEGYLGIILASSKSKEKITLNSVS